MASFLDITNHIEDLDTFSSYRTNHYSCKLTLTDVAAVSFTNFMNEWRHIYKFPALHWTVTSTVPDLHYLAFVTNPKKMHRKDQIPSLVQLDRNPPDTQRVLPAIVFSWISRYHDYEKLVEGTPVVTSYYWAKPTNQTMWIPSRTNVIWQNKCWDLYLIWDCTSAVVISLLWR